MNAKEVAESYFIRISDGHEHAIQRPPLHTESGESADRLLRKMVENANHNGDCIINVGNGYYRPIPGDVVDEKEFHEYIHKDASRKEALNDKINAMQETFNNRRKEGDYAEQQKEREKRRTGSSEDFTQLRIQGL